MTVEVSKASWYSKIYSYLKNRNRIEPAKSKLPDCDFFTVGPRRTLRILKPTQKASESDDLSMYNSEYLNEKFISKWIERPHSSNSCRCSFYKFCTRNNINKQSSPKLNQTKTRFKQDDDKEKTSKFKINVSKDLNQFDRSVTSKENNIIIEEIELGNYFKNRLNIETLTVKNKIIRDLERSIDRILGNVLNHTINVVSTCDKTIDNINFSNNNESTSSKRDKPMINDALTNIPLDIKFEFSSDDHSSSRYCVASIDKSDYGGYVNQAFAPCISDPDKLDLSLRKPINEKDFDMIDCLDSGIDSVEAMEVSIESDFNVENSFTQMIEYKFNQMIESSNLNDENTADNTTQLQINTDRIDFVREENKSEIITEKETTEFTINFIENVQEIVYSDFTSLVAKNVIDEKRLTFDIDSHDKTSLEKNDKIEKFHSTVTLNENVTSKFDDTSKNSDNKETSKLKLKQKLDKSENGGTEKKVEKLIRSCKESLRDSTISKKIRKPIIVFLHGFGSSAEVFENQLQYFSMMGYPCIAPDLLGHGMSSVPDKKRDYHFDKLLNDLEEVLYHYAFKFGQKCVLVAHNYGCSLATALANKYTHEIHRLVLISGGGPIPLVSPTKEGACHCCLRIILSPLLMCGFRRDILYATRGRQHPYCGSEQENQWPFHMKYVLDGMSWPEGDDLFHRRVCVPTLLIHGLKDDKVSLVQECQMERTMPKANLEAISRAGHLPMIDTPNQVNHMIHCFINLLSRKT